jgi:hypothetical protein
MQDCNCCGNNSNEVMYSLGKWANAGYCSLKCVSQDIRNHKSLLNYYNNAIKVYRHEYGTNQLTKEEEDISREDLKKNLQRRTVLEQKLVFIRSLMQTGRLKYNE